MLNGHHLTISNVTRGQGTRQIHLGPAGGAKGVEKYAGNKGFITIEGTCELGNIYGGGLEISSGDADIQMDRGNQYKIYEHLCQRF